MPTGTQEPPPASSEVPPIGVKGIVPQMRVIKTLVAQQTRQLDESERDIEALFKAAETVAARVKKSIDGREAKMNEAYEARKRKDAARLGVVTDDLDKFERATEQSTRRLDRLERQLQESFQKVAALGGQ